MTRTYVPYEGDWADYDSQGEHLFFLWDAAADALDSGISGAVPTPRPRPAGIQGWRHPNDEQGGGSPYGGQPGGVGEAERVADMARRGGAPPTLAGGLAALGRGSSI